MNVQHVALVIPVSRLRESAKWYELLLEPDDELRPAPNMVEYKKAATWIQLLEAPVVPSANAVLFAVEDLETEVRSLSEKGILYDPVIEDLGVIRYVNFFDPDGNKLSLYEIVDK